MSTFEPLALYLGFDLELLDQFPSEKHFQSLCINILGFLEPCTSGRLFSFPLTVRYGRVKQ